MCEASAGRQIRIGCFTSPRTGLVFQFDLLGKLIEFPFEFIYPSHTSTMAISACHHVSIWSLCKQNRFTCAQTRNARNLVTFSTESAAFERKRIAWRSKDTILSHSNFDSVQKRTLDCCAERTFKLSAFVRFRRCVPLSVGLLRSRHCRFQWKNAFVD